MSYVNGSDDRRAHTTGREKRTQSKQIVDYARKLMLADQPAGVEACNECLAQHLMLALETLAEQVAEGRCEFEKRGIAWRLDHFADDCKEMNAALVESANGGPGRRPANDIGDFLRDLLAA